MTTDAGALGAPRFDVVLRGYDRRQVDEHVARLQRVLARMRVDLDAARSQPIPMVGSAPTSHGQPAPRPRPGLPPPTSESPDMIGSFTDRMQRILQAAEEEAAEIRNRARFDGGELRAQLADLVRQRDAVLAELTRMRGQLEGLLAAPTTRVTPVSRRDGAPPTAQPRNAGAAPPQRAQPGPGSPGATQDAGRPTGPGRRGSGVPSGPAPRAAGARGGVASSDPERASSMPNPRGPAAAGTSGPPGGTPARRTPNASPPAGEPAGRVAHDGSTPDAPPPGGATDDAATGDAATQSRPAPPVPAQPSAPGPQFPAADERNSPRSGKPAAHRLPTGAYPRVGGQAAPLRPRRGPESEPGDLFRPVMNPAPRSAAEQQTAAGSRSSTPTEGTERDDRAAPVKSGPPVQPAAEADADARRAGDAEATVAVGAVRSSAGVPDGPTPEQEQDDRADAAGGSDGTNRSASRSG